MYPRPGAPLVPAGLAEVFGHRRVPSWIVRRFGLAPETRLADLDRTVWSVLPAEAIDALADEVVSATRQFWPEVLEARQLVSIDPSGDGLSPRGRNALFRVGLLGTPWLKRLPLGDLAREEQLGAKTLLEILSAGASTELFDANPGADQPDESPVSDSGAQRSRAVRKAAEVLRRRRWSRDVHATDPRLGEELRELRALRREADTAYDAAELLASDSFEPAGARAKTRQLKQFVARADRLRALCLEEELDQIASALLGPAGSAYAVKFRLGLTGEAPCTLVEAGDRVGVTRERVRQLERRFLDAVRDSQPWMPVLDRALKLLASTPMRAGEAETLLVERGLSRGPFAVASVLSAARVFDRSANVKLDRETDVVYRDGPLVSPRVVAAEARRLTTHWGAATVDTLAAELADDGAGEVDVELLRVLLESVPGMSWLDDEKEWFWVRGTRRNRLLNQAEKIISVAGSVGIGELREGVGRFYRMEGFRPPRDVLARLCEQSGLCRREGDLMIEGPAVGPWEQVLRSTIERRIAEVLFEYGPLMRRDDLERIAVDERGLNRSSFYVYLGYSPIISRYAPGVYGLRGARVTAGEVNALIPPRARAQRLVDHGWTSDGRVWLGYRMSESALTAGVLSVPAALQEFVHGSYLLSTEQDRPIGTLVVRGNHMWGVGPFYRRWGVEEGDYVVVVLDISHDRATIASGAEELLLRYQEGD